jgi:N utilization substance protein B
MTDDKPLRPRRRTDGRSRSASRLGVVQALYQMELSDQDSESALAEFVEHRLGQELEGEQYPEADNKYFSQILRGVVAQQAEIDGVLAKATGANWAFDRIDTIMRAILRAAVYELIAHAGVPAKVVVNEYLTVASAFYEDGSEETGYIGGILFGIARTYRPGEIETPVAAGQ